MKTSSITVRGIYLLCGIGAFLTAAAITLAAWLFSGSIAVVITGLVVFAVLFIWGMVLLRLVQQKLEDFTSEMCEAVDAMLDVEKKKNATTRFSLERETLLSRIVNRLLRLSEAQHAEREGLAKEKRQLEGLISDIAHQVRTPMANLKMINTTLLQRELPATKQTEFLQTAEGQLDKLGFLMETLVKASRLETGIVQMQCKQSSLYETIAQALSGILLNAEKKQLSVTVDCPEEFLLTHDSRWTAEALFNLLDNAVKYTPIGGIVDIHVRQQEMYTVVEVKDSGSGIPETEQAGIFGRFVRGSNTGSVEGVGIGLYLTRFIIAAQGGYVTVVSQPEQGAAFSVYLPNRR